MMSNRPNPRALPDRYAALMRPEDRRALGVRTADERDATSAARLMRPADRRACGVSANFQNSCRSAGLPVPVPEYRFDPTRRWRLDYAWPEHKLALEVEGGVWTRGRHTSGTGFIRDMEKYNALACAGWRLLRCVPADIRRLAILPVVAVALRSASRVEN